MPNSHSFLDVRVDNITMDQTVQKVAEAIKGERACNIVTVNPELVMIARENPEFKSIIQDASVVTPDGVSLVVIGRLTGRHLKERVTGVDLCDRLAQEAAKHGWSMYLLGAGPGVAEKAANNLVASYPELIVTGTSDNDPDDESSADSIMDITTTEPDILLVAYGSPTQELWIKKYADDLGNLVTIGVGGSFDFIAGSAKRAPKPVQKVGLEWLWRLILQPKRIKRMLVLPKFAILSLFK